MLYIYTYIFIYILLVYIYMYKNTKSMTEHKTGERLDQF